MFIVGFANGVNFAFPKPIDNKVTLRDAIFDLKDNATEYRGDAFNHEYYVSGYSSIYMSRNRVRAWDEQSFTIQASARQCPIHPQAPKMELISKDRQEFRKGYEHLYRRLTVRECARIQTFPVSYTHLTLPTNREV